MKPIKVLGTKIGNSNTSEWAQVSLFKYHLENNEGEKSHKCNESLASAKIDSKIKHRILNEFLICKCKSTVCSCFRKAVGYFDGRK
jgi:hypothetical protein